MSAINVRRLDDEVVRRLKRRAAAHHRSLEAEVRLILERASVEDLAARRRSFAELASRLRRETIAHGTRTLAEDIIREDRDRGHRPD